MIDLKKIDDRMLKDLLQIDKKKFKKGVYALYLTEAKSRNLDLEFLEYLKPENIQEKSLLDMFSLKNLFDR